MEAVGRLTGVFNAVISQTFLYLRNCEYNLFPRGEWQDSVLY